MPLTLQLNGQSRSFSNLEPSSNLNQLVRELGLKGDRVALEVNGEIVARANWATRVLHEGDRLEMVHFVGGGA